MDSARAPARALRESSRTLCAPQGNPLGLSARPRGILSDSARASGEPSRTSRAKDLQAVRAFLPPRPYRAQPWSTPRAATTYQFGPTTPHHVPICAHHPLPHHVPNCARRAPPRTDPSPVHHVPIWTRHVPIWTHHVPIWTHHVPIWTHHVPIWVRFGPITYRFGPHEASPRTNVEPVPGRPRSDFCAFGNTTYQCGPHLAPPRAVVVRNLAETTPLFRPQR